MQKTSRQIEGNSSGCYTRHVHVYRGASKGAMSGNHRVPTEEKSGKLYTVNINDLAWEFKYCPIP